MSERLRMAIIEAIERGDAADVKRLQALYRSRATNLSLSAAQERWGRRRE